MPVIKRRSANTTHASRRTKRQKTGSREYRPKDDRQGDEKPSDDDQTINSLNEVTRKGNRRKDKCYIHGGKANESSRVEEERSEWNDDLPDNKTGSKFWPAERILRETRTLYLIAWETSSETGQRFKPTWEPKQNANKDLCDEWKRKEMQKKRKTKEAKQAASASEDAGEADSAKLSPMVNYAINATSPNLTPGVAASLKSYQNAFCRALWPISP